MRVVMIPVADRPECVAALKTAFVLASQVGADVIGCHMRPHRNEDIPAVMQTGLFSGLSAPEDWPLLPEAEALKAAASAKKLFVHMAEKAGFALSNKPGTENQPVAQWHERVGTPPYVLPVIGPTADMLVVSRPLQNGGRKARSLLNQALFSSHRPVLILPQEDHKFSCKRIAIGWNRGGNECRTLLAILPLLKTAEDIVFLTAGKKGKHGPTAKDMIRYLSHHQVKARHVNGPSINGDGKSLEKLARQENADLLVCGAYSRTKWQEMIFGGVTHHLLSSADIPVVMMHQ